MAVRALFLDFDGLICDTERAALRAWQELYASFDLEYPDALWVRMAGNSRGSEVALADLRVKLGRTIGPEVLAWQRGRRAQLADLEPARPGVPELLTAAAARGVPVSVVSSSPARWVGHHLTRLRLAGFSSVVTGEDAALHKPSPDLYRVALRRAGVPAGEALAVEDSVIGVRAAKAAGLACVAVPGRPGPVAGADAVLDRLDLLDLGEWT
ncbi:HAD family hydrolase [Acrocarpospora catenulata]|uniref:HAD family hydrolase n=1 Tax=Acrocarpospora catenulata TaxID=2836182 RepID=UPI001BDAC811|nr:HAD family phosphatase [Acrocarpospora catenulata]